MFVSIAGPVLANTVYRSGELLAKNVKATLPAVTPKTSDYNVMGTLTLPMMGQIDAMELSIDMPGIGMNSAKLTAPGNAELEIRWNQNMLESGGEQKKVHCKAFFRCVAKGVPGFALEAGAAGENSVTFAVMRYQLYIDGEEYLLIDQLKDIYKFQGKDYMEEITSLL